jgi:hypothetical protein
MPGRNDVEAVVKQSNAKSDRIDAAHHVTVFSPKSARHHCQQIQHG